MELSISKYGKYGLGLSGILMLASLTMLLVWGLRPGIDFAGGSIIEVRGGNSSVPSIRDVMQKNGYANTEVQSTGNESVLIRLQQISADDHAKILDALKKEFSGIEELRFDSVGPVFSKDLVVKSVMAIVLASLAILVYLAIIFRQSSSVVSSWSFGFFAVLALVHDVIAICGFFAVYAHFTGASADSLFATALLTVIGFSVHDTIVIYNRIKSNLKVYRMSFREIVDLSVLETFTRSLNTSVTTLLVLLALLFFGGSTIRPFVATLCAGIVVGSYSSLFVAAPLLIWWQERNTRTKKKHA